MSSRALRKLQNDEELLASILSKSTSPALSNDVTDDETVSLSKPAQPQNIFALMNQDDEDDEKDLGTGDHDIFNTKSDVNHRENPQVDNKKINVPVKIYLPSKSQKSKRRSKNKKKHENKNKKQSKNGISNSIKDDEEFDKLLLQYQKKDIQNLKNLNGTGNINPNNNEDEFFTASESETDINKFNSTKKEWFDNYKTPNVIVNELKYDVGFTKFPISSLKDTKFNTDFKKLDPHTEFKLLFDDISVKSLDDIDSLSSTSISPQQLKQIQRLRRLVRNWGGKDHRSVPNGPGGNVHRLQFTKVRNDWLPTPRGELAMKLLTDSELLDWQLWQRPIDWKDTIQEDINRWKKNINFYKFEPLNDELNRKAMTEFYLNVITHPDHEALINLIASQAPYHVPGLLQVALIAVRQGDKSNTNGLLQRALFVFDRALKHNILFNSTSCQLPYIYFFNRQFYLTIFRYILVLAQRGAVATASEWTKVLLSLNPMEDPLGCRYFMDHYLLLSNDYQYIIELSKLPIMNCYKEWYTWGFSMGVVLSYLKLGEIECAENELLKCFKQHAPLLGQLYIEKLAGDVTLLNGLTIGDNASNLIEYKVYLARFSLLWKSSKELTFLHNNLTKLFTHYKDDKIKLAASNLFSGNKIEIDNVFYIKNIPINLLRFAILSEESSVMASIPSFVWSDYEVYEFDVLPPRPNSKEDIYVIETVKSFIDEKDLLNAQAMRAQDEELMNQIRQLSLNQYIEANEMNQFSNE
ncbi:hypothetical protein RI543_000080 [Arxiozyma heterogenica]|uniref:Ribosome quality control complex subunit 1 n=1 Tax=Arxiozyma heterogenica TaxID=278026 RepID=A0AAN8A9K1_9SACH|nr:hypothetical protein RI543_000080 [Kazachstania heterogenica]